MERALAARGVVAGAIAGLIAFVFGRIAAEPQIQKAIDYEAAREAAQHALAPAAGLGPEHGGEEIFSRAVQANVGLGVGLVVFGAAMGALFAVAYAICLGRTGQLRARPLALLVAGGGFLAVYLVPFVKYPANPPAVGNADTIGDRSGLYLLTVFVALVALLAAVWLGQRLRPRFGNWNAALLAAAAYGVAVGVVLISLPSMHETPGPLRDASGAIAFPGFPADVLYQFRFAALGVQAVLWSALGLIFAPMAERLLGGASARTGEQPVLV